MPIDSFMETQKLTVRLPVEDIAYVKGYARRHGITLTEAVHRYLVRLKDLEPADIHPELSRLSALAPADADAREAYLAHLEKKHR